MHGVRHGHGTGTGIKNKNPVSGSSPQHAITVSIGCRRVLILLVCPGPISGACAGLFGISDRDAFEVLRKGPNP